MDASALVNALIDDGPVGAASRSELARDLHWAAPEHLTIEVFSAIRGRHLGRQITLGRAADALAGLAAAQLVDIPTAPLLGRMWQLRDNVSGYDAAYVAAAESSGCALVTCDTRLAAAAGPRCEIRLALPDA